MAGLSITGQSKVSTLQEGFLREFGLTLRVYDGRSFADPTQTLAQVRKKKGTVKGLSVAKNMKVGNLEDKFEEEFGLKVQVAGLDDSYLCDNKLTLNAAQQADEKKLDRKERKAARQDVVSDRVLSDVSDDENDDNIKQAGTIPSKLETGKTEPEQMIEDNNLETNTLISEKISEVQTDGSPDTSMKEISLSELTETEVHNEIQVTQDKFTANIFDLVTGDLIDNSNLKNSTQQDADQQNTDDSSPEDKFMQEVPLSDLGSTKENLIPEKTQPDKIFSEFSLKG